MIFFLNCRQVTFLKGLKSIPGTCFGIIFSHVTIPWSVFWIYAVQLRSPSEILKKSWKIPKKQNWELAHRCLAKLLEAYNTIPSPFTVGVAEELQRIFVQKQLAQS